MFVDVVCLSYVITDYVVTVFVKAFRAMCSNTFARRRNYQYYVRYFSLRTVDVRRDAIFQEKF